jgi:hypothetical protein
MIIRIDLFHKRCCSYDVLTGVGVDISSLSKIGKVAGVPGVALGAATMALLAVIAAVGAPSEAWRGPVLLLAVLGAAILAILAVFSWATRSAGAGSQSAVTKGDRSPAVNLDKTKTGGKQSARTEGADSPAQNTRG